MSNITVKIIQFSAVAKNVTSQNGWNWEMAVGFPVIYHLLAGEFT